MLLDLNQYQPRAADVLAFSAGWRDWEGLLIKVATCSRVSHIAGIARVEARHLLDEAQRRERLKGRDRDTIHLRHLAADWYRRPLVIESTTLCADPCKLLGRSIDGVQAHDPHERITSYLQAGGRVWLYRPTPDWYVDPEQSELLARFLLRHVGDAYDYRQAITSAARLMRRWWWFQPANLHAVFCSELWDAALQQIRLLAPDDYSVVNPARLLRTLVKIGRYELSGEF
jgi:hypothetical protein